MPVSLAAEKMKIVTKATPAVPFSIRKHEVGVVSWGYSFA
jgi:hypothetical protein